MIEYFLFMFFCLICILLMYFLRQKAVAFAIMIIFGLSTFTHLVNWWSSWDSGLGENLDKIDSIVDKVYGTARILESGDSSNESWYYNNPVQKGANGLYKRFTGKNPDTLEKE